MFFSLSLCGFSWPERWELVPSCCEMAAVAFLLLAGRLAGRLTGPPPLLSGDSSSLLIPGGGGGACWEPRPPAGQPVRVGLVSSFIYYIYLSLVGITVKAESRSEEI